MTEAPLSALLSHVLVAHTIELDSEFERRFQEAGGGARVTSWTMWANLLRFVGVGLTVGELVPAVGLPRPTVLSRIGGVERWGYVSAGPAAGKREGYGSAKGVKDDWVVQPTPAGRRAARIWPKLPAEIEARWRERFGEAAIDELASAARALDEATNTVLPDYLPVVSSTHGMTLELGSPMRNEGSALPLVTLLAHALMAYTLAFERRSALALPLSENVVRVLDDGGVPVRELAGLTGISKEAVAVSLTSLARTEHVAVEGSPASKRTIRLTPAGAKLRSGQARLHAELRTIWEAECGHAVVSSLQAALERLLDHPALPLGLAPYPDGWRASKPYAKQTKALLEDPRGALPHHPMVLHRGGWPDGS